MKAHRLRLLAVLLVAFDPAACKNSRDEGAAWAEPVSSAEGSASPPAIGPAAVASSPDPAIPEDSASPVASNAVEAGGGGDPTEAHALRTVFLIVMENHPWTAIDGSRAAPYINHTLLPQASYATNYHAPPHVHPSEPNYLWLEAGDSFGVTNDGSPFANHQPTHDHLVNLLEAAGISWTAYQEDIRGTTCPLTRVGEYRPKHNPFVYFDDVTGDNDPASVRCIAHVRPYAELASDLAAGTVARYNFITPNLCHDMHDHCPPLNSGVAQGDAWLAAELPRILESRAYRDGGVVIITWDDGGSGNKPIGLIVLSPEARGGGYASDTYFTHSSTLRTLQEIFGVTPLLGDAAHATSLAELFTRYP